jgi:hypothetical protein
MTLKHLKPSDALTMMTCKDVAYTEFPPWKCVLGNCLNCPKYKVPRYENDVSNNAPRINLVMYKRQSHRTIHGTCGLGKNTCNFCLLENAGAVENEDEENVSINKGKKAKIVIKKFPTLQCAKI